MQLTCILDRTECASLRETQKRGSLLIDSQIRVFQFFNFFHKTRKASPSNRERPKIVKELQAFICASERDSQSVTVMWILCVG